MRMRTGFLVASVLVLASSPGVAEETYYVRTGGSDAEDGLTPETALATIQAAVNRCDGPGHTIFVGAGEYREQVEIGVGAGSGAQAGTESEPNRIVGDVTGAETGGGSGAVVIAGEGSRSYGVRLEGRGGWRLEHLTFRGQRSYAAYASQAARAAITDCTVESPGRYGFFVGRCEDAVVARNRIDHSGFLRSLRGRRWGSGLGIYVWASRGTTRVTGNRIFMTGPDHLSTGFRRGLSTRTPYYGIIAYNYPYGRSRSGGDTVIENNVISDCYIGAYAIAWRTGGRATLSHNSVTGCGYGLYGYGYQARIEMFDNIVTDSYYGAGVLAFRGGSATVAGLMTDNVRGGALYNPYAKRARGRIRVSGVLEDVDPLWVDASSGNLALSAGSPAIEAGYGGSSAFEDIRGGPRPYDGDGDGESLYDLGAWEYNPHLDGAPSPRVVRWIEVEPER